jgi:hypothetical protein
VDTDSGPFLREGRTRIRCVVSTDSISIGSSKVIVLSAKREFKRITSTNTLVIQALQSGYAYNQTLALNPNGGAVTVNGLPITGQIRVLVSL